MFRSSKILSPLNVHKCLFSMAQTPIENSMRSKLINGLNPSHLVIVNESFMHSVPKGSETHFKVVVVSSKFDGKSAVERHRLVHGLLGEELKTCVHALSITAKTPSQWDQEEDKTVKPSPKCLGGFGK